MLNFSKKLKLDFLYIMKKIGYVGKNRIMKIVLNITNNPKINSMNKISENPKIIFIFVNLKKTKKSDIKESKKINR